VDYPVLDVPRFGGGMLIAVVAIVHVVIAHFAVGAGIYNAISETIALRRHDALLLAFIKRNSKFLILFAFVAGAITGVGIWFTISIVSPRATAILIRNFVWGWATEWVFFLIEIVTGYVYYYSWDRMSPWRHAVVGWIYAFAAWMSLVVINAILTYMLSAGTWQTNQFWGAFLDPTFWASLILRTISGLALAGLFALIVVNLQRSRVVSGSAEPDRDRIVKGGPDAIWYANTFDRDQRTRIVRYSAWYLAPIVLMLPAAAWWFYGLPADSRSLVFGGAIAMTLFFVFGVVASVFIGLYAYLGLIRGGLSVNLHTGFMLASLAVVATGSMEFVREGIRKPFVINSVMYSNQITPAEGKRINEEGFFAKDGSGRYKYARFVAWDRDPAAMSAAQRGRLIFRGQCAACHVEGGANDLAPLVRGWSAETLDFTFARLHELKRFMPPFFGTEQDRADLVAYCLDENASEAAP
jgi:mono/diheme cytochrome c family protein